MANEATTAAGFHITFEEFGDVGLCCDAECPKGQFRCTRARGHVGPHVATATDDGVHDFCAAWSAQ